MKETYPLLVGLLLVMVGCGPASTAKGGDADVPSAVVSPAAKLAAEKAWQYRLAWNRDTLVGDYERHGNRNAKWDQSAADALDAFAVLHMEKQEEHPALLAGLIDALNTAVTNGCDDPMIRYLHTRFVLMPTKPDSPFAADFLAAARDLRESPRAPIRKFYASLRASDALNYVKGRIRPDGLRWREEAKKRLREVVRDKSTPAREVFLAWEEFFQSNPQDKKDSCDLYLELEPIMLKNWAEQSPMHLLRGFFYCKYAWEARGNGLAGTVTPGGWEGFKERLQIAEEALLRAWQLDPTDARIARQMLTVELGQGRGRQRMEQWFARAMTLNTNYFDACHAKLYYLEPKWHGSRQDMYEFACECLWSNKWGANVPLIMVDAHVSFARALGTSEQAQYWKRPEVWKDIRDAFLKYYQLNLNTSSRRQYYALYAYRAEQWDELNRQLKLLGPVKYSIFGGKEKFDEMVQLAKEHAKKAD